MALAENGKLFRKLLSKTDISIGNSHRELLLYCISKLTGLNRAFKFTEYCGN